MAVFAELRRDRRVVWLVLWAPAILGSSVYALRYVLLVRHHDAPNTATVLGLPITLAGLAVAFRPGDKQDPEIQLRVWAKELAKRVLKREEDQFRRLLGDDTERINLVLRLRPQPGRNAQAPGRRGRLFEGSARIPDIAEYYRATAPRRLVVSGAPGAGKTVVAVELVLALIDSHENEPDAPVPVRVSLAGWDTERPLDEMPVRELTRAYDWSPRVARSLVEGRRVLPVLDGLDEMDPAGPDGGAPTGSPRAREALKKLNALQESRRAGPVVLTCRTAYYDTVDCDGLVDAARLEIDPVTPSVARAYLRARTTRPDKWTRVFRELRENPTGALALALSTPWRLCLAASVYRDGGDPGELLQYTDSRELHEHLLSRYIPAATILHPRSPGRAVSADRVHRQLAVLARQLEAGTAGGTDLALDRLWAHGGRRCLSLAHGVLGALPLLLVAIMFGFGFEFWGEALTVGIITAVPGIAVGVWCARPPGDPKRLRARRLFTFRGLRAATRGCLRLVIIGVGVGLAVAAVYVLGDFNRNTNTGPWKAVAVGSAVGLAMALGPGLVVGFAVGTQDAPRLTATSRDIIRTDLTAGLLAGVVAIIPALWLVTVISSISIDLDSLPLDILLVFFGVVPSVVFAFSRASVRYLLFLLYMRGRLPLRLGAFLDWCCTSGLMRVAGSAYQFRHRELQQWLARNPVPPAATSHVDLD